VHEGEPGERRVDGMEAGGVLRNPKERRPNDFCGISKVRRTRTRVGAERLKKGEQPPNCPMDSLPAS